MKEYKIKIDVNKEQITAPYIELVAKDYNSTALVFECDNADNYMMIFQLLRPDGTVWRKEIRDNRVVLGEENEAGEIVPVITANGEYCFDVAFYDGDSKITTTKQERLFARAEIPQENVSELPGKSILDDLIEDVQEALNDVENIRQEGDYAKEQGDYAKQEAEKVDNSVEYITKTAEEAKEIAKTAESLAKGANQCKTYGDYPTFIEAFNLIPKGKYKAGQDVRIVQVNVPDIWVAYTEEESVEYVYTTDEAFVEELTKNSTVQVGYYKFGMLETQKVDLKDYVKNTDYASMTKGGVVKMWTSTNEDGEIGLNISTEV